MSTILHLRLALAERRLRRKMRQPERYARVMPYIDNRREVEDGGLTWPEALITAGAIVGWLILLVVTL